MFKGVFTALITPFLKNKQIDFISLQNLLIRQEQSEVDGVVILGTTAEECTLTNNECLNIIEMATKTLKTKKIIVGVSGNCTQNVVDKIKVYNNYPIDGYLVGTPYYNKPTSKGLVNHFVKIALSTQKPIMLYNIPGRCGVKIDFKALEELKPYKNIVAIKEASGDIDYFTNLIAKFGDRYSILCGNDNIILPMLASGAVGCVSVLSNYLPQLPVKIYKNYALNITNCIFLHNKFNYFVNILFIETNPMCIKYVLYKNGLCRNILRAPLVPIKQSSKNKIDNAIIKVQNNLHLL